MPITDIMPAVITVVSGVTVSGQTGIKYVSHGPKLSVAESVAAWVQNGNLTVTDEGGSDKEWNDWTIVIRLITKWVPDTSHAEKVLEGLIDPVRQAFRAHIKMAQAGALYVHRALIHGATWGYDDINGVIYRWVDLTLAVREKVPVSYSA